MMTHSFFGKHNLYGYSMGAFVSHKRLAINFSRHFLTKLANIDIFKNKKASETGTEQWPSR